MQYRLIIFMMLFGIPILAASTFTDVSLTANVYQRDLPIDAASGARLGSGTAADYDNNGWRDLYGVNGDVDNSQKTNRNRLYHNQNGNFVDQTDALNVTVDAVGRGATTGDFDNDGAIDVYIVNNISNALLQNDINSGNRSIKIRLRGTESNRDRVGTRGTVTTGNHVQTQELICGRRFLGSDSPELEFGIPSEAQIGSVTLMWPSGIIETYDLYFLGEVYTFIEAENVIVAVELHGKQSTTWGRLNSLKSFRTIPIRLTRKHGYPIDFMSRLMSSSRSMHKTGA